jgi:hypothetical protein
MIVEAVVVPSSFTMISEYLVVLIKSTGIPEVSEKVKAPGPDLHEPNAGLG